MRNVLLAFLLLMLINTLNAQHSIIPEPVSYESNSAVFVLGNELRVIFNTKDEQTNKYANQFIRFLEKAGIQVLNESSKKGNAITISLNKKKRPEIDIEGYKLTVTDSNIALSANEAAGIFNGLQTLRQLLPASMENTRYSKTEPISIKGCEIIDYPRFKWRGLMLDVSRHFFTVDEVKTYIAKMSQYKFNVFHWHLSDDQGWRIEIKSWPNLTNYGGSTQVGGGEGGFYTQEQYKDIVSYAADRFITIIPEIDMPGHTNAALASYPELNCDNKAPELYTGTKVGFSTLCTNKEITYKFIDDVVREISEMTPGPYIHIGGDESHVTAIEDYIPFINRVQDIVHSYDKKVIGWDEIAHADLKKSTVVQFWAREENAKKGIAQDAKVIMSPSTKVYLDMKYDSLTKIGLSWAAFIELDSAYLWTPDKFVKGINKENILGVESPLWTETITTLKDIEYMAFPRIIGHAEIGWTPTALRNWDDYKTRLKKHTERLKIKGVNFYDSKLLSE